ncbi:MAG: DUF503 domain-containing protein [Caldisericaceae bacterium]|nr:DUF503 domain-containing protein [Caldisericaceae bacterium]
MRIGICTVRLGIPNTFSLKDKRQVCSSLFSHIRQNFNVSVAEVSEQDSFRKSVVAIVAVNTSSKHLSKTLSKVVEFIEKDYRVMIEDYGVEII